MINLAQKLFVLAVLLPLATAVVAQDALPPAPPQAREAEQAAPDVEEIPELAQPELTDFFLGPPGLHAPTDIVVVSISAVPAQNLADYHSTDKLPELAQPVAETIPALLPTLKIVGYRTSQYGEGMMLSAAVAAIDGQKRELFRFVHRGNCNSFNTTGQITTLLASAEELFDSSAICSLVAAIAMTQDLHRSKLELDQQLVVKRPADPAEWQADRNFEVILKPEATSTVSMRSMRPGTSR